MINQFWFCGESSLDYGIIMATKPDHVTPERDVTAVEVPGRNGALIIDNHRWKNVTLKYKCNLLPRKGETFREAAERLCAWLLSNGAAYSRLENTYYPEHYRIARVAKGITVESIVDRAGTFEIEFDCKPQRFLCDGERIHTITVSGSKIINQTLYQSSPIIRVYGSGEITLSAGQNSVRFNPVDGWVELDCDLQDAYKGTTNKNNTMTMATVPALEPGENTVGWVGNASKVEITPRWWTV